MEKYVEYLVAIWPLTPLFLFVIAVTFRLLDNSTYLFLQKDILVNSSNVSRSALKSQIRATEDPQFTRQLKRALLFRNLQQSFLISAVISLPVTLLIFFLA